MTINTKIPENNEPTCKSTCGFSCFRSKPSDNCKFLGYQIGNINLSDALPVVTSEYVDLFPIGILQISLIRLLR